MNRTYRALSCILLATAATAQNIPKTSDGRPSLAGIWTNATLTPLERPRDIASKEFFTEQEAAAYLKQRMEQTNVDRPEARRAGEVGSYNQFWFDRGNTVLGSRRTSQIIDPPDGRVPPMTPEAQKKFDAIRAYIAQNPADGPEARLLTERCILFGGAGPPMLVEPYNNNYEIVQSPGYVAILAELNHDARVIPVDGRAHLPGHITQWMGNSRGRWEKDTLVVESRGLKFSTRTRFGVAYDGMTDENLKITERFTRTGPETIVYRATIDDPTIYTKPWTVELQLTKRQERMYEYACHEGNYGMFGILEGTRATEPRQ